MTAAQQYDAYCQQYGKPKITPENYIWGFDEENEAGDDTRFVETACMGRTHNDGRNPADGQDATHGA